MLYLRLNAFERELCGDGNSFRYGARPIARRIAGRHEEMAAAAASEARLISGNAHTGFNLAIRLGVQCALLRDTALVFETSGQQRNEGDRH